MAVFSEAELQQLIAGLSIKLHQSGLDSVTNPIPISSVSGDGFLISNHVSNIILDQLQDANQDIIRLDYLVNQLDISPYDLQQLLVRLPEPPIYTLDRQAILTDNGKVNTLNNILAQTSSAAIALHELALDNAIDEQSIRVLVERSLELPSHQHLHISPDLDASLNQSQSTTTESSKLQFIYTYGYHQVMEDKVYSILKGAVDNSEQIVIRAEDFIGAPALAVLGYLAKTVLEQHIEIQGTLKAHGPELIFASTAYNSKQLVQLVTGLRDGSIPYHDTDSGLIHDSTKDLSKRLEGDVVHVSNYIISKAWLKSQARDLFRTMNSDYFVLSRSHTSHLDVPLHLREGYKAVLRDELQDLAAGSDPSSLVSIRDDFLVHSKYPDILHERLIAATHELAKKQWESSSTDIVDYSFSMEEIISQLQLDEAAHHPEELVKMTIDNRMISSLRLEYAQEISALTTVNEAEFARYWHERVVSRLIMHIHGAESLQDQKLHGQILDVLRDYTIKELIPDALEKAQKKRLIRSKKTKRYIDRLQADILSSAPALSLEDLRLSINKLSKDQPYDAAKSKSAYLTSLSTRLPTKSKEAPQLYLILVISLLARYNPGVVYASGKFAPKLMRQLKGNLLEPEYAQLEVLKDKVRQGQAKSGEMEEMRDWVSRVVEEVIRVSE